MSAVYKCTTPVWLGDTLITAGQLVGAATAARAPECFVYSTDLPEGFAP